MFIDNSDGTHQFLPAALLPASRRGSIHRGLRAVITTAGNALLCAELAPQKKVNNSKWKTAKQDREL